MTPPNYFRFVKHSSGGDPYDGYSVREDENFETSGWGIKNYSAAAFTSREDENFETSGWGIKNYSAAGFTSREDENFESGSLASGFFPVDDTDWWND